MISVLIMAGFFAAGPAPITAARDQQDRAALQKLAADYIAAAEKAPNDADAQYKAALAESYLAEVNIELHDKKAARDAAEHGIPFAEKAAALNANSGEYYRILGTLYGQAITDFISGMKYGPKSKDSIGKAVEKAPKSSAVYVARGVGNLYLPTQLGGGPGVALPDFQKAIELDPKNAEAYLFLGIALRDQHKNVEARQAFQKSLELDPNRAWTKQQLDKTPAQ
jgi:tetratricopeptide (TPR) repeat protein